MDRRLRIPLLAAAALHLLVGAGAGWVRGRAPGPSVAGPRNVGGDDPAPIEASLDDDVFAPTAPTAPASPAPIAAALPAALPGALPAPGVLRPAGALATLGGSGGAATAAGPDAKEALTSPGEAGASSAEAKGPSKPFPSLVSSPGKHAFILPAPKPSVSPEVAAQNKLDASLAAAAASKDTEIGLGAGGPVVSAAHDVSIGSDAPDTGTATVDVETDATGMVTEVHLVESSDALAWKKVAGKLHKRLATTRLTVPKGAAGVTVRVKISAALKLPSGAAPGQPVTVAPKGIGIGGQFDLADIGQSPKRVVGVTVLRETRK